MRSDPKHGMAASPLYRVWQNMKDRCLNPKNPYFHNYGGRGIRVHPAWAQNFETFMKDVGPRPSPKHTLDRIENNGPYAPGNVRWATKKAQAHNMRKNHLLTLNGRTQPLAGWAEEKGLAPSTLHYRLATGMSQEQAITLPRRGGRRPSSERRSTE